MKKRSVPHRLQKRGFGLSDMLGNYMTEKRSSFDFGGF